MTCSLSWLVERLAEELKNRMVLADTLTYNNEDYGKRIRSWIFSYLILSVSKTSSRGQHFGTQILFSPTQLGPCFSSLWLSGITFSHTKAIGPFSIWPFDELSVSRYCSTHWYGFPKFYSGLQKLKFQLYLARNKNCIFSEGM